MAGQIRGRMVEGMAGGGADLGFLADAAVFLGAAVAAVPIFKRLGLGSVIGYLAAGALIGPPALGLVDDPESVMHVAEFGVVLLLFVIGLELRPARLWRLRTEIFGLGLLQVAVTGLALVSAFLVMGLDRASALTAGLALALSSTAFAIQLLREKGALTTPLGDRAFSILLFQDLAIVPLLAMVAFLAPGKDGSGMDAESMGIAVGAIIGLLLVGRYVLPHVFAIMARTKADEIFTAAALLVVIGASLLMDHVGLSMATGAFLAGVLLAETEFRHQLETDIEPFRGLLLGLFFMSFGMTLDVDAVAEAWWIVIGGAIGLFLFKIAVLAGLARAFGSPLGDALKIGAYLGQGGEFAFVLFGAAVASGVMPADDRSLLSAVVTLSMALTPLALLAAGRMTKEEESEEGMEDASHHSATSRILVAGFGRVGQVVARVMRMRGYEVTLIDNSPRRIRMAGTFGAKVYYGDARRIDVLRSAGAEHADMIFLCIDDRDGARAAVERLRHRFPEAIILADTYDRFSQLELFDAGAHEVVRETFESAVKLARLGLERMGDGDIAEELLEEFRRRDAERTRLEVELGAQKALEKLREKYSMKEPF